MVGRILCIEKPLRIVFFPKKSAKFVAAVDQSSHSTSFQFLETFFAKQLLDNNRPSPL